MGVLRFCRACYLIPVSDVGCTDVKSYQIIHLFCLFSLHDIPTCRGFVTIHIMDTYDNDTANHYADGLLKSYCWLWPVLWGSTVGSSSSRVPASFCFRFSAGAAGKGVLPISRQRPSGVLRYAPRPDTPPDSELHAHCVFV